MAFREVRIREAHNRLVFKYDDERNVIEIMLHGKRFEVALDDYQPLHRRLPACAGGDAGRQAGRDRDSIGVDFRRIEGEERTE